MTPKEKAEELVNQYDETLTNLRQQNKNAANL
jgi:ABC-type Fe3+-hydroxamate transport system substrate-binding protein